MIGLGSIGHGSRFEFGSTRSNDQVISRKGSSLMVHFDGEALDQEILQHPLKFRPGGSRRHDSRDVIKVITFHEPGRALDSRRVHLPRSHEQIDESNLSASEAARVGRARTSRHPAGNARNETVIGDFDGGGLEGGLPVLSECRACNGGKQQSACANGHANYLVRISFDCQDLPSRVNSSGKPLHSKM